ncbi:MAG: hypothetical protein AAF561_06575 [Planctomycetota bacterium]
MAKLEIEVSDEMLQVLARMGEKSGKSPAEALIALLDREVGVYVEDQKRFNDLIAEGDDNGPAIVADDAFWERKHRQLQERLELRRRHREENELDAEDARSSSKQHPAAKVEAA